LRKNFPTSFLAFLVEREPSELLFSNPYLDELIILDREEYGNPFYWLKKVREIRKKGFDLVIDFLGTPRSAYLCFLSGARMRVGYRLPFRQFFYNLVARECEEPMYSARDKLRLLKTLKIDETDVKLDFFIPNEVRTFARRFFTESRLDRNNLIVSISPTSRRRFRRWHLRRYAQLADWLISRFNAGVVLVWGPGEKEVVEEVKNLMREKPVISWETENLFQLGAILERCDLHIGNDNGTKHIAVALGKPTITIYGPQDPINWTYPDPLRHRFLKKDVDCPDCDKMKHKCRKLSCLNQITVEDVQKVFLQLLKDLKKGEEKKVARKIEHLAVD